MSTFQYLQHSALLGSHIHRQPFHFFTATGTLAPDTAGELDRDYPKYRQAGFLPYDPAECGPTVNHLVEELTSHTFAEMASEFLQIDQLHQYPTLITLCHKFNKRFGTIHTDSQSKVATALLYMNASWPETSAGCLRFLNTAHDIEDMVVPELRPLYGNLAMFKRAENSFHGHLPFEGERRVIQIAWLVSEAEKNRKNKRGKFTRFLKQMLGGLDARHGANRDDNAAHLD